MTRPLVAANRHDLALTHDARDPVTATTLTRFAQIPEYPGTAINAAAALIGGFYQTPEALVLNGAIRLRIICSQA